MHNANLRQVDLMTITEQDSAEQQLATGPIVYGGTQPLWMQPAPGDAPICYTAQDYRFMLSMMYPAAGVVTDGAFAVTQHGNGDNTVDVAGGPAVLPGNTVSNQGNYFLFSPATINIQPPGPPITYPRYDVVILGIEDGQVTSTGEYRWYVQVVSGDEAATPLMPALPNDCLQLGVITRQPGVINIVQSDIMSRTNKATGSGLASFPPGDDLNNVVLSGIYRCTQSAPVTANGPGAECIVYVGYSEAGYQTQIAVDLAQTPRQWLRAKVGGAWGAWVGVPGMPAGSRLASNISLVKYGIAPMCIAPALPGICTLSGDTYTVQREGIFQVTLSNDVAGNYSNTIVLVVHGITLTANYGLDYSNHSRAHMNWQGYCKPGDTIRGYMRNNSATTRTFARYCWLTYGAG
jgi:hypothetical protein